MKLNYEQEKLIEALFARSIREAKERIHKAFPHADEEIKRLCAETLKVLQAMTEAEFAAQMLPEKAAPGQALSMEELKEYLDQVPPHTVVTVVMKEGV